jgi:hypothetical protein
MPVALMGYHIAIPGIALQSLLYSCSLGALAFWFLRQRVAAISWDDAAWIAGGFFVAPAPTQFRAMLTTAKRARKLAFATDPEKALQLKVVGDGRRFKRLEIHEGKP